MERVDRDPCGGRCGHLLGFAVGAIVTGKLGGKLDYSERVIQAMARWAEVGAKKPKRNYGRRYQAKDSKPATTKP